MNEWYVNLLGEGYEGPWYADFAEAVAAGRQKFPDALGFWVGARTPEHPGEIYNFAWVCKEGFGFPSSIEPRESEAG